MQINSQKEFQVFLVFAFQSSWFSMRTRCTTAATGTTWLRSPAPGPRPTSSSRPTCTTPSGSWRSTAWASASPVYPPACSRQMRLVRNKSSWFFNSSFFSRSGGVSHCGSRKALGSELLQGFFLCFFPLWVILLFVFTYFQYQMRTQQTCRDTGLSTIILWSPGR